MRPISGAVAAAAVDRPATISNPAITALRIRASLGAKLWGDVIAQFRNETESQAAARLQADAGAVSRALRLARGFAVRASLAGPEADQLAVVVEEWVANVVEHGGPQDGARIVLRLRREGQLVRLTVSDAGRAFDPRVAAFQGPNHERGGGAGLALIASHCRIADYVRRAGRNRVVLEMRVA